MLRPRPATSAAGVKRPRPPTWLAAAASSSLTTTPRRLCGCCCLLLASAAVAAAAPVGAAPTRALHTVTVRATFQPPPPTPPPTPPIRRHAASSSSSPDDPFSLRTPVPVDPLPPALRIKHSDPSVLLGSCFSTNIGSRLQALKYTVDANAFGTSYNPISIQRGLLRLLENRPFELGELGRRKDGVYYSFEHHTSFEHADPTTALDGINRRLQAGHDALLRAKHVFLTLGTAHVYEWVGDGDQGRRVVANCHRLPQALFERRLLGVDEIIAALEDALRRLRQANPAAAVTLTVSPVRHLRNAQGPVANARSKAHLLAAVHALVDRAAGTQDKQQALPLPPLTYFPAYEIMMDELRDYRFYDADMLHPSPLAVDIIFYRLQQSHFAPERDLLKSLAALQSALAHRPSDPTSAAHQAFLQKQLEALQGLEAQHPHLDLAEEARRLRAGLLD